MVEIADLGEPSAWIPESDPVRLAALGKAEEELGECIAAVARCLIQGIDGAEPVTKVPNRVWLTNEVADVQAAMQRICEVFRLDPIALDRRYMAKLTHFRRWGLLIEEEMTRRGQA